MTFDVRLAFALYYLSGGWSLTSAALMHPMLMAAVGMMGMLVQKVIFPLQIAIVLGIVGNLFHGFPVKRLAACSSGRRFALGTALWPLPL